MKASYQKETVKGAAMAENSARSPLIRTEGGNRFISKGESRECFYFGVARKLIGDKWSLLILLILRDGSMRFNALLRGVEGISQKVLAAMMRELERDGYIRREVIHASPPCVQYSLTTMGRDFLATLATISGWVESNWQAMEESRREFDSRTEDLTEIPQVSPGNHS
jgi:DNA-binding HxlR family transcriptional regulator